jgi:hypothetical protein
VVACAKPRAPTAFRLGEGLLAKERLLGDMPQPERDSYAYGLIS